jgi:hypothetical protein
MEGKIILICKKCGIVYYYNYCSKEKCKLCGNNNDEYDKDRFWYITKEIIEN